MKIPELENALTEIESKIAYYPLHREFQFHPVRKFRFDYAFPKLKIAVEYEGGIFTQGRHTKGVGYARDCYKYNLALSLGWKVFRITPITKMDEIEMIKDVVGSATRELLLPSSE